MANDIRESFLSRLFTPKNPNKMPADLNWPLLQVGDAINVILACGGHFQGQISKRYDVDRYEGSFSGAPTLLAAMAGQTEATVYYLHNNRSYGMIAGIHDLRQQDERVLLDFTYRAPAEKMKQRQYFRLPIRLPVRYRPAETVPAVFDPLADPEEGFQEAHTLDISGGGLRMKTDQHFELGQILDCRLVIGAQTLSLAARVVREEKLRLGSGYEVCLGYDRISECDRNTIIRHIFAEQRKFVRQS